MKVLLAPDAGELPVGLRSAKAVETFQVLNDIRA
jgi:hypothetical protein